MGSETRSEQHLRAEVGKELQIIRMRRKAQKELHTMHLAYRAMARGMHHFTLYCLQRWAVQALRRKLRRERDYGGAQRAARRLGMLQHVIHWYVFLRAAQCITQPASTLNPNAVRV